MGLCKCNYVILQTNRARCALNEEILDLLTSKAFLERAVIELVYKFDEKSTTSVEKVRQPLQYHLNIFGGILYI